MSDPTPDVREGDRAGTAGRRYRAFISYSHADTRWANWLMRRLEGYRVPRRFQGRVAPIGEVGARIAPVFRDRDELATTSDLGEAVRGALRAAETLVVICSPRAAASRWVNEEICEFKRRRGSRQVFALIVDGEPKAAGTAEDCFPRALRFAVGDDGMPGTTSEEVVAADARPQGDGPRLAFVRLVAGLLGVGFDDLRQRELLRRQRRLTLIAAAAVAGMVITLGLAAAAWRARNEAVVARNDAQRRQDQAEDVLSFMLGDFRADLEKVGQLSLLERVGDKAMGYFDALEPSDLTDTALARQAKALTQIGEVKLLQKNVSYAEAGRAFFTAYQRAAALAARYPKNGDMLFERAQAEYWIGFTHLRRGDLAPTAEWFERYRDSTETLAALDPRNLKWRREQLSGQHNLAVLEFERGNLEAARGSLERQRESLLRLRAEVPDNRTFQFRVTDVDSWLGAVAEREGRLPEAVERFAAQRAGLERLLELEPTNSQWRFKLADCLMWETDVLAIVGEVEAARGRITRSEAELQALLARDPQNRRWNPLESTCRHASLSIL